jgi:hypothetical protein
VIDGRLKMEVAYIKLNKWGWKLNLPLKNGAVADFPVNYDKFSWIAAKSSYQINNYILPKEDYVPLC